MTKPTKWHVRPAKTQISLGIRTVWSMSVFALRMKKACVLATHWAHSEDSDQTGWTPRLIWVFAGRIGHIAGFVMRRLTVVLRFTLILAIWLPSWQFSIHHFGLNPFVMLCVSSIPFWKYGFYLGNMEAVSLLSVFWHAPSSVRRLVSVVRPPFSKIFFSKSAGQIKAKFHMEPQWIGWTKVYSHGLGHMTKLAATPIYGKNPSKSSPEPKGQWPCGLVCSIGAFGP